MWWVIQWFCWGLFAPSPWKWVNSTESSRVFLIPWLTNELCHLHQLRGEFTLSRGRWIISTSFSSSVCFLSRTSLQISIVGWFNSVKIILSQLWLFQSQYVSVRDWQRVKRDNDMLAGLRTIPWASKHSEISGIWLSHCLPYFFFFCLSIISGASSGIGKETTRVLALRGVHVVMAVRNTDRGAIVKEAILKENPSARIDVMELDVSSMASVRKFASEYSSSGLPLNLLM